jgi:MFS family permease
MTAVTYANESSSRPAPTPWGLVILLGSLTAMGPLAIDMYLSSLPAIGASLHASPAQTQGTMAAFLAGMAIGQVFYGPASDRLGRRGPILLGVAIFTVASAGCAWRPQRTFCWSAGSSRRWAPARAGWCPAPWSATGSATPTRPACSA